MSADRERTRGAERRGNTASRQGRYALALARKIPYWRQNEIRLELFGELYPTPFTTEMTSRLIDAYRRELGEVA